MVVRYIAPLKAVTMIACPAMTASSTQRSIHETFSPQHCRETVASASTTASINAFARFQFLIDIKTYLGW